MNASDLEALQSQKRKWDCVDTESSSSTPDSGATSTLSLTAKTATEAERKISFLAYEMKQIMRQTPMLVQAAMDLLDLYFCLWDSYVLNSARKIQLEKDYRLIFHSNAQLVNGNRTLKQVCDEQELLLWDRQQAFLGMNQGMLDALHSSRFSIPVADLP